MKRRTVSKELPRARIRATVTLADYITHARVMSGRSLRELARLSGMAPSYLSEVEAGAKFPTLSVVTLLASALEVDRRAMIRVALADLRRRVEHAWLMGDDTP